MFEFFPEIRSVLDWSLLLAFLGIIFFYFGKVINSVFPYKEDKYKLYISGMFFFIAYVLFPIVALYALSIKISIRIPWVVSVVLLFISGVVIVTPRIKKLKNPSKKKEKSKTEGLFKRSINFIYYKQLNNVLLLILTFLIYWFAAGVLFSMPSILDQSNVIIYSFFALVFLFISITGIAMLYSWNLIEQHPKVVIHLRNNKKLRGDLIKIEQDLTHLRDNANHYHIMNKNVLFIEEIMKTKLKK